MSRKLAVLAFAMSVMVIIGGSLYPFHYRTPVNQLGPFVQLALSSTRWPPWGDFLRNIVFYAPMGFLAGFLMSPAMPPAQRVALIAVFGAVLSFGNEVMQYYVGRYTSMLDVYANVLGSLLGILIAQIAVSQSGRRTG